MFINEEIVAVIFRLINFISIIGLGVYIFKQHVASDMWDTITKKNATKHALCDQHVNLEKKQRELDHILKEESLECEQFRLKIDEWKNKVAIQSAMHEKQRQIKKDLIAIKAMQRAEQKEHARVQTCVATTLIPELQKSLSCHFSNEKNGTHYINSIVHFMNERI